MKELVLIRHAKSDWGNDGLRDVDRHLNERGYSDAYMLSEWFAKGKAVPELILSSSATRALSTALIFARAMKYDMQHFKIDRRIYESSMQRLLAIICEQDDSLSSLMLAGHNPSLTDLCNHLAGDLYFDNVPTCGIISFQFEGGTWKDITKGKNKLNYFRYPKDFKNKD